MRSLMGSPTGERVAWGWRNSYTRQRRRAALPQPPCRRWTVLVIQTWSRKEFRREFSRRNGTPKILRRERRASASSEANLAIQQHAAHAHASPNQLSIVCFRITFVIG